MTRVTSFGIKRTYLEAGFTEESQRPIIPGQNSDVSSLQAGDELVKAPPKKRKRTKKSQRNGNGTEGKGEETEVTTAANGGLDTKLLNNKEQKQGSKAGSKKKRINGMFPSYRSPSLADSHGVKARLTREASSELRRQSRIAERNATTTCFACRAKVDYNCSTASTLISSSD